MRLKKFGHCCLLIEEAGSRLLMDPGSFSSGFEGLTRLTGVLVTHIHGDHLDVDRLHTLLESNPDARVVCDEASVAALAEREVRAHVVHAGDQLDLGVSVRVYGREHAVIRPDLPADPNVGYLVADRFFYAGDAFGARGTRRGAGGPGRRALDESLGRGRLPACAATSGSRARPRSRERLRPMIYHLFEQRGPEGTKVNVLDPGIPLDV